MNVSVTGIGKSILAFLLTGLGAATAGAQTYPVKPIRFVLAFGASGGAPDTVARTIGPKRTAGELFNRMAGVKMVHIPCKGGGAVVIDLIAGQVDRELAKWGAIVKESGAKVD